MEKHQDQKAQDLELAQEAEVVLVLWRNPKHSGLRGSRLWTGTGTSSRTDKAHPFFALQKSENRKRRRTLNVSRGRSEGWRRMRPMTRHSRKKNEKRDDAASSSRRSTSRKLLDVKLQKQKLL